MSLRMRMLAAMALWLAAGFAPIAFAQSITAGDVTGTVTDPTGAAVPRASVRLTNTSTNVSQNTTTSGNGTYHFGFIAPGVYRLDVTAQGFQAEQRTGIVVTAASRQPAISSCRSLWRAKR
jgi:hypothetical protein